MKTPKKNASKKCNLRNLTPSAGKYFPDWGE